MPGKLQSTLVRALTSHIHQSQREVTILFTDIEDSTRYWGNRGDVEGRLMVDRHNRLLLPLVHRFHGKVVKTIGDSIMAMFDRPEEALCAAIAMQQALQQAREADRSFPIHVRIGLHIGEAIVEQNDVYGDVVNVAARIEAEARGDEILISGRLARRLDKERFKRSKQGGFTPKGKHRRIALYRCHWQEHEALLDGVPHKPLVPLDRRQRLEVLGYALLLIAGLYFLNLTYLRYLLADHETLALFFLNPTIMVTHYWYLAFPTLLGLLSLLWRTLRIRAIPYRSFKLIKGAAAGAVLFVLLHGASQWLPLHTLPFIDHSLYESDHLFVEVLVDNAVIRDVPGSEAATLLQPARGTLLLLSDVRRIGDTRWNKVLIGEGAFGWIERVQPPQLGVPERRITWAEPFTLRYRDLLLLLLSLPAAVWGYRSFHARPF